MHGGGGGISSVSSSSSSSSGAPAALDTGKQVRGNRASVYTELSSVLDEACDTVLLTHLPTYSLTHLLTHSTQAPPSQQASTQATFSAVTHGLAAGALALHGYLLKQGGLMGYESLPFAVS